MKNVVTVPFNKAFLSVPVGNHKIKETEYLCSGRYKVIDQGQNLISGYSNEDNFLRSDFPYIIFGDHTKVVKFIDFPFIVGADGVRLYKASKDFSPEYLYYFLRSSKLPKDGYSRHSKYLENLLVPKFELDEQHQIEAHIKAQFAELEKAHKAMEEQWVEIQNVANAIISDSIRRKITIRHKLGDVLNEIKKGIGESWKDYPVLGATRNGMALAKEPPGQYPQRYKPVVPSTVFYNPMRILIGSIAFMDEGDEPGITSPDYVVFRGKEGLLDSRWFYYWLRSPLGEQCINSLARGAVRERMLFNRLAEGEIELPDFSIQKNVSESLKELVNIKKTIKKQLDEIKLIPNKLLAQAFKID